jgi:hypothetical protein
MPLEVSVEWLQTLCKTCHIEVVRLHTEMIFRRMRESGAKVQTVPGPDLPRQEVEEIYFNGELFRRLAKPFSLD